MGRPPYTPLVDRYIARRTYGIYVNVDNLTPSLYHTSVAPKCQGWPCGERRYPRHSPVGLPGSSCPTLVGSFWHVVGRIGGGWLASDASPQDWDTQWHITLRDCQAWPWAMVALVPARHGCRQHVYRKRWSADPCSMAFGLWFASAGCSRCDSLPITRTKKYEDT